MSDQGPFTRTRIVATIGPASSSASCIRDMLDAGVDLFRLNFSHSTMAKHGEVIDLIRDVESKLGRPVGIMADLPGPKLRLVSSTELGHVDTGSEVRFAATTQSEEAGVLQVDQAKALGNLEPGHRVLLDDGAIRMLVLDRLDGFVRCSVLKGGAIRPRVGVNLPDSDLGLPAVGEQDVKLARFALEKGVDFIAVSFCRDGDDIRSLRNALGESRRGVHLVAKIERPVAVENLHDIVEASDVLLVARGDLGVEMDVAVVPLIQKQIVTLARRYGRPVIVATQMLQSMIESSSPTRAESSDVANAILDGADAVMLSGETAIGEHPALVVETMDRIARKTEEYSDLQPPVESAFPASPGRSRWMPALARGAWRIAEDLKVDFVAAYSCTGESARLLSREGIRVPILVLSDDLSVCRRMQILRGVIAIQVDRPEDRGAFRQEVQTHLRAVFNARTGATCLAVSPPRFDEPGLVDGLEVLQIQDGSSA